MRISLYVLSVLAYKSVEAVSLEGAAHDGMINAAEMDPEFDQMMLAQQEYDQAV